MDTEKCCECKGPLPEELPHSIIVCSDNCWNKFHWKIYRSQLLFIGVFGLILIWVFGSAGNILGVALFSAITTALVMLKYMQMEKYSFSENEIQERLDEIKREQLSGTPLFCEGGHKNKCAFVTIILVYYRKVLAGV